MKANEILKKGKKTSKVFFIFYFVCMILIIISAVVATEKVEAEKPNAADLAENGVLELKVINMYICKLMD